MVVANLQDLSQSLERLGVVWVIAELCLEQRLAYFSANNCREGSQILLA